MSAVSVMGYNFLIKKGMVALSPSLGQALGNPALGNQSRPRASAPLRSAPALGTGLVPWAVFPQTALAGCQ